MGYVNIDIDVLEERYHVLNAFSNKELEDELKGRKEGGLVVDYKGSFEVNFEVHTSDIIDDVLEDASDDQMIGRLEMAGYVVYTEDEDPGSLSLLTKRGLAIALGLKWFAS